MWEVPIENEKFVSSKSAGLLPARVCLRAVFCFKGPVARHAGRQRRIELVKRLFPHPRCERSYVQAQMLRDIPFGGTVALQGTSPSEKLGFL